MLRVYDDVTYVYDDVTYDVTYVATNAESGRRECCVRKCAKRQKKPLHTAKETY